MLRKVALPEEGYLSLAGAQFRIFRADLTEWTKGQPTNADYYESVDTGVYFVGSLPCGEYYVVETQAPTNSAYSGNINSVFTLRFNETGEIGPLETAQKISSDTPDETLKRLYDLVHPATATTP